MNKALSEAIKEFNDEIITPEYGELIISIEHNKLVNVKTTCNFKSKNEVEEHDERFYNMGSETDD